MQSAIRSALFFIAIIFIAVGAISLAGQIRDGEEIRIILSIICFGIGFGLPVILLIYPDMFSGESLESGEPESDGTSSYFGGNDGAGD